MAFRFESNLTLPHLTLLFSGESASGDLPQGRGLRDCKLCLQNLNTHCTNGLNEPSYACSKASRREQQLVTGTFVKSEHAPLPIKEQAKETWD
jgi:hypothetical protein